MSGMDWRERLTEIRWRCDGWLDRQQPGRWIATGAALLSIIIGLRLVSIGLGAGSTPLAVPPPDAGTRAWLATHGLGPDFEPGTWLLPGLSLLVPPTTDGSGSTGTAGMDPGVVPGGVPRAASFSNLTAQVRPAAADAALDVAVDAGSAAGRDGSRRPGRPADRAGPGGRR